MLRLFLLLITTSAFSQSGDSIKSIVKFNNQSRFVLEEGISAEVYSKQGKGYLRIKTDPAPTKGPAVYFVSAKVTPGKQYTYFIKGFRRSSCRVLHYVTHPKGNLLWPGADVEEGISRSVLTVPDSVSQITLALSFLYPKEEGYVLIEDIALYEGNVETWPGDDQGLKLLLSASKNWIVWLYLTSIVFLVLFFFFTQSNNNFDLRKLKLLIQKKNSNYLNIIIFVSVGLSSYQFLNNRSLWLDEASLALSIVNRNYFELLFPLDYGQVAQAALA